MSSRVGINIKRPIFISWLTVFLFCLVFVLAITTAIGFGRASHWFKKADKLDKDYYNLSLDFDYASTTVQRLHQDVGILEEELTVMTKRADQVASLSALAFLLTPDEINNFIEQIPVGSPFKGDWYVTARYGADRGHSGNPRMGHRGNDIVVMGSDWGISPTGSGTVVDIGIDTWLGKYIVVEHTPRVRTVYAHLDIIYYEALPGETVTPDTIMGIMGSTGFSDGAHLHYEVQVFNGESWLHIDSYPYLTHPSI